MKVSPDVAALNPHLFSDSAPAPKPAPVTRKPRKAKRLRAGPVPWSDCLGGDPQFNNLLCPACDAPIHKCVTSIFDARFEFDCGHVFQRRIKR